MPTQAPAIGGHRIRTRRRRAERRRSGLSVLSVPGEESIGLLSVEQDELRTVRKIGGKADAPDESGASEELQDPPSRIPFAGHQSKSCRPGKRVMVVVPAFTHREQRCETHVAALNGCAADFVSHASVVVREISDEPVSEHAGGDARADAPEHEAPAATPIEEECPGQMLEHPGLLQESVEMIM